MSGDADWGPWVQHDGKSDPVPEGFFCLVRCQVDHRFSGHIEDLWVYKDAPAWLWAIKPCLVRVIEYRICPPRGMAVLLGLLEKLPDTAPDGGAEVVPIKARPQPQKVQL